MNPTDKVMLAVAVLVVAGVGVIGAYYLSGMDREPEPIEIVVYYEYTSVVPNPVAPGEYFCTHTLYTDGCPEGTLYHWDSGYHENTPLKYWDKVDELIETCTCIIWTDTPTFYPALYCPGYTFTAILME